MVRKAGKLNTVLTAIAALVVALAGGLPVAAADVSVSVGTNGSDCSAGGYITPANVIIDSGDTLTFSVPTGDAETTGIVISGFDGGSFTVPTGGSASVGPITSSVAYSATSSAGGCAIGSGTVTVNTPAQPAATGTTTPATGASSGSAASSPTTPTTATPPTTAAAKTATPTTAATSTTAPKAPTIVERHPISVPASTLREPASHFTFRPLSLIITGAVLLVLAAATVGSIWWLRRHRRPSVPFVPRVVTPIVPPAPLVATLEPEAEPIAVVTEVPRVPAQPAYINPYKILVQ